MRPGASLRAKKVSAIVVLAACVTGALAFWLFYEPNAIATLPPSAYYVSLALDDEYVYAATTMGLLRIAKRDGAVRPLVELENPRQVSDVRVVDGSVYFTITGAWENESQLCAVSRDGENIRGMFAHDGRAPASPIELVNGGDGFYVLSGGNSWSSRQSVVHVPATGGLPTVLVSGLDGAHDLTVEGSTLYWREQQTTDDEWTYKALPRQGGSPIIDEGRRAARVADARYIYRTQVHEYGPATYRPSLTSGGTYRDFTTRIVRTPKGGGPSQTIYETKANREVESLAADADYIYWVEERHPFVTRATLLLMRMKKPGP